LSKLYIKVREVSGGRSGLINKPEISNVQTDYCCS
jgi:hypothetical protein